MPANLPPEYFEVERRYREAESPREKIALLEELISTVPKHKGTDHLRADLRRQLAKLKAAAQSKKKPSRQTSAFHITREGAGQAVLVGLANVGKSALVAALTNADPEVADYPYTTWVPTPGMMPFENIQIQLVDTPPLDLEFNGGELFDLIRRADLILLVIDLQADPLGQVEDALTILQSHRIIPQRRSTSPATQEGEPPAKPMVIVVNKCDDERFDADYQVLCELLGDDLPILAVSAVTGRNLEELKRLVFEHLGVIRVYSKPPGKEPDLTAPFVLKKGTTVEELAGKVHKDFLEKLKSARIWGSGAFDGQPVGRDYVLHDGDIVELRI
jgi:ribosome-interacting GTPase 1